VQKLIDAKGAEVLISTASLSIEPEAVSPGDTVLVELTLKGSAELLRTADLSNISADLIQDDVVLEHKSVDEGSASQQARTVRQRFVAPMSPGSYVIKIMVPGIESFQLIFAVLEP
jgi:hypothetical protein